MANKTQCPNCLAVYIITDEQWQKSKGKVRCGSCRQPFVASLLPDVKPSEQTANQSPESPRTLTKSPVAVQRLTPQQDTPAALESLDDSQRGPEDALHTSSFNSGNSLLENARSKMSIEMDDAPQPKVRTEDLINEVDSLIDEKLGASDDGRFDAAVTATENSVNAQDDLFDLSARPKRSALQKWAVSPILLVLVPVLLVTLIYQLWLRQALPILESESLVEHMSPVLNPTREFLSSRFDWQLPERRDLANLRLSSAHLEPHPLRASTVLLKVSLVNKSNIAQPYPWLELELLDVDGHLVSRRALSPLDYLHNNRVTNFIRANELRPITIELLAFPRQAHGFELKLIDR